MLIINSPDSFQPERSYIYKVIFNHFLGVPYQLHFYSGNEVRISIRSEEVPRSICLVDEFFEKAIYKWLSKESLSNSPLEHWIVDKRVKNCITNLELPIIFGHRINNQQYMDISTNCIRLGLDIFGSAFFMLTRYEEYVKPDRDEHNRFPATASLAMQEGFLDRPIINEYVEILWWCMKRLWPELEKRRRIFRTVVSHDVDIPFGQFFSGLPQIIRKCGGDIIKRGSPTQAVQRILSWQAVKREGYRKDPNYTFDRIMDISESNGIQSNFYFKTACTELAYDDNYSIDHPYIRQLMREIHNRGHKIGIHPSYRTYNAPTQTQMEYERLRIICDKEGIQQDQWGGRQHFLRWQVPITWRNWAEAGIDYDSTLSYADHAGFRCGVCYEFPVYDLERRKQLSLIERPLVVMEGSILEKKYMALVGQEAMDYMNKLKGYCKQYNGEFTLLWHNSSFESPLLWDMYSEIVSK